MRRWSVVVCLLLLVAGVAQAQETGTGDYSEIEKIIQAFRDADTRGDVVVAVDPTVVSPFGGPSQLPPETTGPVTIDSVLEAIVNTGPEPLIPPPNIITGAVRPEIDPEIRFFTPRFPGFRFVVVPPIGRGEPLTADFLSGRFPDAVLVGEGDPFGGKVVVDGGVVEAPIPLDCPDHILEYGRVDAIEGQPIWEGFAPNDIFNGGSQAIVTRCTDGQWELERLVNGGQQFAPMPTETLTLVFPEGWISFTPFEEVQDSMGSRHFGFVTPLENPFQPDTTGSTATPFPGLDDPGFLMILNDPAGFLPGPPVSNHPTILQFSNGSCPPETWQSPFEIFVVDGGDGPALFMEQLETGQLVSGTLTLGPNGTFTYVLDGSGPGYTEHYEWSGPSGTYQHTNSATCTWDVAMDSQISEALEEDVTLLAQQETTTTAGATTTTVATTTTAVAGEEQIETTGSPFWPWVLIALGLAALGLGGFFLLGTKGPCDELRKAWEAAERRRKSAQEGLDQARRNQKERKSRVSELEADLAALEKSAESSVTEHGVTKHLIDGGMVTSEGLQSLTESKRRELASAQAAQADAEASVKDWEGKVAEAAKAAEDAKRAYDDCVGEHTPKTPEPEHPGTVTGGPAVATPPPTQPSECREGDREVRPAGNSESINVDVDFSLFVEVLEGSERKVNPAKTLAIDLADLANQLGTLGSMLGAYGSGRSTGQGVMGMAAGKYTVGGGKLMRGGVQGYIAGADPNIGTESFPISIPTSPQEVVTEFWEGTARLGSIIADKVGDWLKMNQLYQVRISYFFQTMTAAPHQVWVCRGGRWVCEETIYEVTIGKLQKRPGPTQGPFRLESDIARHRMEREIDRMTNSARSTLRDAARRKAEFEQAHQPGPCK